jgi:hypothetical protein
MIATFLSIILAVFIIVTAIPLIILTIFQKSFKIKDSIKLLDLIKSINNYLYNQILKFAKNKSDKKKSIVSLIDPRINIIKELPDFIISERKILPEHNIVVYYEPQYSPLINEYLQENKIEIEKELNRKWLDFLYIGDLDKISLVEAQDIISYFFPQLNSISITSSRVLEIKETFLRDNLIGKVFNSEVLDRPCFIKLKNWNEKEYNYSVYYLPEEHKKDIEEAINYYLWVVTSPINRTPSVEKGTQLRLSADDEDINLGNTESPIEVSSQFKNELERLLINNGKANTLKTMLTLIEKVSPERLGFEGKVLTLLKELHTNIQPKISDLIISPIGGIYLKDYKIEIKLTPLQKTVYLFFLSKPKGIYFKDLPTYKKELLEIYSRISSRSDLETLRSSIEELTNPYSNSMSEKCSRIKEAFLKQIDEEWAKYYYISGERNEEKVIKLDRSKVIFEESNY